jgi:NTE family protein
VEDLIRPVGFVFGGGGMLGAYEVGMVAALAAAGIAPDLVVGTSVGAINGVVVAADPAVTSVGGLVAIWEGLGASDVFADGPLRQLHMLARHGHLHSNVALRDLLRRHVPVTNIEQLPVPYQCVAASIERAGARWFTSGPLVEAVLASCAVPGLLPPVEIDGEHFVDGGIVDSIPVGRAVLLGAKTVFVLHAGRVETPLRPPRRPWETGLVAFEIARRHRFNEEMNALPEGVTVHVLPTGAEPGAPIPIRYRNTSAVPGRVARARAATAAYLSEIGLAP